MKKVVLVCGGRAYKDRPRVFRVLDGYHKNHGIAEVVHGACRDSDGRLRGADRWAEEWAISREVPYRGMPARFSVGGPRMGSERNRQMLTSYQPHVVFAFPGGKGTRSMIDLAKEAGVLTFEFKEDALP